MDQIESSVNENGRPWYIVRVRANAERPVAQALANRGVSVFLPLAKRMSRRRNVGLIEVPLFPGYLFAQFEHRDALAVITCPGVVQVLCRGRMPEAVDPAEIRSLILISRTALSISPMPGFVGGQKVRVSAGPLNEVEGIVLRDDGRRRLVLSLSLLRRSVAAEIGREWVEDVIPAAKVLPWMENGN